MHGWGVKRAPDGFMEVQRWGNGELDTSLPVVASERCSLTHLERGWMFASQDCINGLAHGRGVAASLDGMYLIPEGRFVLGNLVDGDVLELPVDEANTEGG